MLMKHFSRRVIGIQYLFKHYRTWFYFYVTGVDQGTTITFTIENMSNQSKLFSYGMKPFFRVMPRHQ